MSPRATSGAEGEQAAGGGVVEGGEVGGAHAERVGARSEARHVRERRAEAVAVVEERVGNAVPARAQPSLYRDRHRARFA